VRKRNTLVLIVLAFLVMSGAAYLAAPNMVKAAIGDIIAWQLVSGATSTDVVRVRAGGALCVTADGTCSKTDTAGTVEFVATREENLPLLSFADCQTATPTVLSFVASGGTGGADALADFENFTTAGRGFTLSWDNVSGSADTDSPVCTQIKVPAQYASGGAIIVRGYHSLGTGAGTSVMSANYSVNGTVATAGTANLTTDGLQTITLTPTATLAANDALWVTLEMDSFGGVAVGVSASTITFQYTANQ